MRCDSVGSMFLRLPAAMVYIFLSSLQHVFLVKRNKKISADVSLTDDTSVVVNEASVNTLPAELKRKRRTYNHISLPIKFPVVQLFKSFYYVAAKSGNVRENPGNS